MTLIHFCVVLTITLGTFFTWRAVATGEFEMLIGLAIGLVAMWGQILISTGLLKPRQKSDFDAELRDE